MKQPRRHTTLLFITLGIIAVVLLLIDMATGDTYIPIPKVWAVLTGGECDEMTRNILLSIRFIRVVVAGLIGIALSVSGLQMQTVFQNPLADPYLLGVSSGAGLGVALFILGAPLLGWADFPLLQSAGIVGSGWIGTAVILLGVAIISRKVKNILGVLIMGESGIGKSEAALELIKRGHRLVSDDVVEIRKVSDETLVGSAPDITRHFIELRGIGIIDAKALFGVESVKDWQEIDLVIKLEEFNKEQEYDRLGLEEQYIEFLDSKVVCHSIPIRPGRNVAIICESAAVNHRQKKMGYNAAVELYNRVTNNLAEKRKNNK